MDSNYLDFGVPLSFGWTCQYLDRKTQTRRQWKDSHAAKFLRAYDRAAAAGQQLRVSAIDKGYHAGGKQIGWCIIPQRPYKQRVGDMPESDLLAEGGMVATVADFIAQYFKGKADLEVWVINFEFVPSMLASIDAEENLDAEPVSNPSVKVKPLQTLTSAKSDEHNTPAFLAIAARSIMGGIDLDPMSNAIANQTIRAHRFFTKTDDGLSKPWCGRVWLNPPFSLADRAVPKLIADYESGDVFEAVLLLKSAVETKRYQLLYDYPFVELNKRVNYTAPGNKDGAPFATVLFYLGSNFTRWREVMSTYGRVHPGARLFRELESDRIRLFNENASLKNQKVTADSVPGELKHHEKCRGRGCGECDFGWSRETDWEAVSKGYEKGWNPDHLLSWLAQS